MSDIVVEMVDAKKFDDSFDKVVLFSFRDF
jgi:hypothetical protein